MDISNNLPTKIPIFPLSNFIVFPETTVPLNIFEKRYLKMIDDSMASNRLIGMIQPKKTGNLKKPDLFDVGCVCKIISFNEAVSQIIKCNRVNFDIFEKAGYFRKLFFK